MTADYVEAGDGAGRGGGEEGEVTGGVEVPTLQAGSTLTVRLQLRREEAGGGEADQAGHHHQQQRPGSSQHLSLTVTVTVTVTVSIM